MQVPEQKMSSTHLGLRHGLRRPVGSDGTPFQYMHYH